MHRNLLRMLVATAALLVTTTALATTVDVSFAPAAQSVNLAAGSATVDIVATISGGGGLIGWGLDLGLTGTSVSLSDIAINETDFDAAAAFDGDGLAALVPLGALSDGTYTLATLTFSLIEEGLTTLDLSYTDTDPTEGFPLHPNVGGGFADATFTPGSIEVVPEPTCLSLLAVGVLFLRRR